MGSVGDDIAPFAGDMVNYQYAGAGSITREPRRERRVPSLAAHPERAAGAKLFPLSLSIKAIPPEQNASAVKPVQCGGRRLRTGSMRASPRSHIASAPSVHDLDRVRVYCESAALGRRVLLLTTAQTTPPPSNASNLFGRRRTSGPCVARGSPYHASNDGRHKLYTIAVQEPTTEGCPTAISRSFCGDVQVIVDASDNTVSCMFAAVPHGAVLRGLLPGEMASPQPDDVDTDYGLHDYSLYLYVDIISSTSARVGPRMNGEGHAAVQSEDCTICLCWRRGCTHRICVHDRLTGNCGR